MLSAPLSPRQVQQARSNERIRLSANCRHRRRPSADGRAQGLIRLRAWAVEIRASQPVLNACRLCFDE